MATWNFYVSKDIGADRSSFQLVVPVAYYDSTDPANSGVNGSVPPAVTLHDKTFTMPINTTTLELQAAVIAEGVRARLLAAALASALVAVPKGTRGLVP